MYRISYRILNSLGCGGLDYIVVSRELHEDGTPHYHVFVRTSRKIYVTKTKWDIDGRHGNYQSCTSFQAWDRYVKKGGDFKSEGDLIQGNFDVDAYKKSKASKRSLIAEVCLEHGPDETIRRYPEAIYNFDTLVKNYQLIQRREAFSLVDVKPPEKWYTWQKYVLGLSKSEPDQRSIHWFVDDVGNTGKSFLAKFFSVRGNCFYYQGGKKVDILYAYNGETIVCADFTREKEEDTTFYSTLETIKGGIYLSSKFHSMVCRWPGERHIFCFANWEPKREQLSIDRWWIYRLDRCRGLEADVGIRCILSAGAEPGDLGSIGITNRFIGLFRDEDWQSGSNSSSESIGETECVESISGGAEEINSTDGGGEEIEYGSSLRQLLEQPEPEFLPPALQFSDPESESESDGESDRIQRRNRKRIRERIAHLLDESASEEEG